MMRTILRAADHLRMPWKNGRGETVQIAVYPRDADLANFGWRISMAGVAEDGAFSVFEGVDRSLAVLTGAGIALQVQGMGAHRLTPGCAPLAFAADAPTGAQLIDGPITDLNVMTRRGLWRHSLSRGGIAAPFVAEQAVLVATAPISLGRDIALGAYDALICAGDDPIVDQAPPDAWVIRLGRV